MYSRLKKKFILKYFLQYNLYLYRRESSILAWLLFYPLSLVFAGVTAIRRWLYQKSILKSEKLAVPVIVVGNISVGGTGKTPLVIWLCQYYQKLGYTPGIVTRGYGAKRKTNQKHSAVVLIDDRNYNVQHDYPDEAHLCWLKTNTPIGIARNRVAAGKALIQQCGCNLIIADDGLQHYALQRDFEIAVVDYRRCFGNGHLLPFGPLREPIRRLAEVNEIVVYVQDTKNTDIRIAKELILNNGKIDRTCATYTQKDVPLCALAQIQSGKIRNLKNIKYEVNAEFFHGKKLYAVAGIGDVKKYFNSLLEIGIVEFLPIVFPDHYQYSVDDFVEFSDGQIIMTEKDAVKCFNFCKDNFWTLPITVSVTRFSPPSFI